MECDKEKLTKQIKDEIDMYIDDKISSILARKLGMLMDFPLTVHQVAALTGRKEATVYKMCQREVIPYTKVGKSVYVNLRHLSSVLYSGIATK